MIKRQGCVALGYLFSVMVRMMFIDVREQLGGGALLPDDDKAAVDALSLGAVDLVEMFPSSARIEPFEHLLSVNLNKYLIFSIETLYKYHRGYWQ